MVFVFQFSNAGMILHIFNPHTLLHNIVCQKGFLADQPLSNLYFDRTCKMISNHLESEIAVLNIM